MFLTELSILLSVFKSAVTHWFYAKIQFLSIQVLNMLSIVCTMCYLTAPLLLGLGGWVCTDDFSAFVKVV